MNVKKEVISISGATTKIQRFCIFEILIAANKCLYNITNTINL
jgi:hypothetical protein